jgi:hypothetical protein
LAEYVTTLPESQSYSGAAAAKTAYGSTLANTPTNSEMEPEGEQEQGC